MCEHSGGKTVLRGSGRGGLDGCALLEFESRSLGGESILLVSESFLHIGKFPSPWLIMS